MEASFYRRGACFVFLISKKAKYIADGKIARLHNWWANGNPILKRVFSVSTNPSFCLCVQLQTRTFLCVYKPKPFSVYEPKLSSWVMTHAIGRENRGDWTRTKIWFGCRDGNLFLDTKTQKLWALSREPWALSLEPWALCLEPWALSLDDGTAVSFDLVVCMWKFYEWIEMIRPEQACIKLCIPPPPWEEKKIKGFGYEKNHKM